MSLKELENVVEKLKATTALVAILKHYGKIKIPSEMFKELSNEQIFPNDFITINGSAMCVTYDKDTDEVGFELMYEDDGIRPENTLAFICTRGNLDVGSIDYNHPLYKK